MRTIRRWRWPAAFAIVFASIALAHATDVGLPPPSGPIAPRVAPVLGDDGLYHQSWFLLSFLDLRQDFRDAQDAGKRLAVLFEQCGCSYCAELHTKVLARKYINDYVRQNFAMLQLDLWGARGDGFRRRRDDGEGVGRALGHQLLADHRLLQG
jgi:thioredoxin-related protein